MRRIVQAHRTRGAATRRLVISDLHFGSGDELAHHPERRLAAITGDDPGPGVPRAARRARAARAVPGRGRRDELPRRDARRRDVPARPLGVAPGIVCFAHTDTPLRDAPSTDEQERWRFYNSGSWMWDRRLREHPRYRATARSRR